MRSELRPLITRLGLSRSGAVGSELFLGSAGRVELVAARSGIGMEAARKCTTRLLEAASPDHVVVVGIAGGLGESVAVGDLVVPETVLNLETGDTFRPAPLGEHLPRGTLASSDTLLESPADARRLQELGVIAIDMETAAVASVCSERGRAWSVFRAISDRADDGTTDAAVLGLAGPDGTPNLAAVTRFVLGQPHRIPQLVRLGRGAARGTRRAADAAANAIESC